MADSIPGPWIVDYLIDIAEQYGANISSVPRKEKAMKAQLVKFLTFPPPELKEPCSLWVEISDKRHIIRARLSVDAISAFEKNPIHGGRSITSHKSAFVSLKKFRPALGRVARRDGHSGLTEESTLFLDVDEIVLKGAFGEPMWGSPAEAVSDDPRIRDWIHGLRQDGGAGNVLKLRKQEAIARAAEREDFETRAALKPPVKAPVQATINPAALDTKVRVARKLGPQRSRTPLPAEDSHGQRPQIDKEALRRAAWKRFHTKVVKYFRPPDDVLEQLMSLAGQPLPNSNPHAPTVEQRTRTRSRSGSFEISQPLTRPSHSRSVSPKRLIRNSRARTPQSSSPPRSPSNWSPSVRGSPQRPHASHDDSSETEEEPDVDADTGEVVADSLPDHAVDGTVHASGPPQPETNEDDSQGAEHTSSSFSMPPPAQPRRALTPSDLPYATSQPLPLSQGPAELADHDLPPSSFPIPPSSFPDRPSSPLDTYQRPPHRLGWSASEPLLRRVPPPICNAFLPDPNASGDGRVLVENSDTASPGSQPMGMSQSQSQSQSQGQSQSQSQNQSQGRGQDLEGASSQESEVQQSQPPSKLRNEIERARSGSAAAEEEQDVGARKYEEVVQESQPVIGEDVAMAEVQGGPQASPSQDVQSEESQKSRQSLSYLGDSQSQDKSAEEAKAPAPPATEAVVSGTEHVSAGDNEAEKAPPAEVLEENLQQEAADGRPERRSPLPSPSLPPSSPMQVDGQPPPAPATAPTWAVMRPVPSADDGDDDSQEEEANVDELLSDPIDVDQDARPSAVGAKNRRNGAAGGGRGKRRLDPDDARTAAMVDQYVSEVRQKDGGKTAGRSGATDTHRASSAKASRSRQPSPPMDGVPLDRTMKRRKKGDEGPSLPHEAANLPAFEKSSKQPTAVYKGKQRERDGVSPSDKRKAPPAPSANEPPPSSQPSRHDPMVWAAPTFMRKPLKPKQAAPPPAPKMEATASSTTGKTADRKRPASGSPGPQNEARPAKKRKTSSAAVSVVSAPATLGTKQQQDDQSAGKSGVAAKAPSARPAQAPQKRRAQAPPPVLDAEGGSSKVKYVDLRAASRSSSRSSSRAPPARSRGTSAASSRMHDVDEQSSGAGKDKGKAPMRSARTEKGTGAASSSGLQKMPVLPVLSGAKAAGGSALPREELSTSRRPHADARSDIDGVGRPPPEETHEDTDTRPLLDGYKVSLELVKEPGGPPVLDWEDFLQILQRTGSYRRRERDHRNK